MRSFLSLTPTQYFLLNQWYEGLSVAPAPSLGGGERLDKVVLENCLGGRYSPGIDLTFIVRDPNLYCKQWQGETGPFRIDRQELDYSRANRNEAFLQVGYLPLRNAKVEPGDLSKFMSQPWHTDYNSCATHTPDPNPVGNNTLYWSWPAQRPANVYPASQCSYDASTGTWNLGGQLYSIRGNEGHGTSTPYPQQQGRYQCYFDFVENWHKVGFVIQGLQIPAEQGGDYGADKFLEVASLFDTDGDMVEPWPTAVLPGYQKPKDCGPK
ncbi:MAG: LodA/GoxA family CTQ-dependent oxidase, partial [Gammaproteobacteria bacterium]